MQITRDIVNPLFTDVIFPSVSRCPISRWCSRVFEEEKCARHYFQDVDMKTWNINRRCKTRKLFFNPFSGQMFILIVYLSIPLFHIWRHFWKFGDIWGHFERVMDILNISWVKITTLSRPKPRNCMRTRLSKPIKVDGNIPINRRQRIEVTTLNF